MWKDSLKSSGIYRTNDKIENFKINIKLKTINSLIKIPKFHLNLPRSSKIPETPSSSGDNISKTTDSSTDDNQNDDIEILTLKWQDKIFNQYEINTYKNLENCITDAHKIYHNEILSKSLDEIESNCKIFTYTNDDNFQPENDYLYENYKFNKTKRNKILTKNQHEIIYWYICADLNPNTILFTFQWLPSEKIFVVYPDFNDQFELNPYFIEIDSDYRHLFCYTGSNVSDKKNIEVALDSEWFSESFYDHLNVNKKLLSLFDIPPKRYVRYSILLNIKEAKKFEYNNLHIRYHINLPDGIIIENSNFKRDLNDDNLEMENNLIGKHEEYIGCTHSSKSVDGLIWYFGYSFQLNLLISEFTINQKDLNLKIFFEVISIDDWERERTEGYTYFLYNLKVGNENFTLNCFRPLERTIVEKLRRFFIGGRVWFDLKQFFSSNEFLNRYQCECIGTGEILINVQCISQRNPESIIRKEDDAQKLRRRSPGTLEDIMKSYQEARKRLEATILD